MSTGSTSGARLALPVFPAPDRGGGFPIVASIAPLVAAGVIFAVTRSPFALLFAIAAPLAAAGGLVDRRIRRRRAERRAIASLRPSLARLERDVASAHMRERDRLGARAIDPGGLPLAHAADLWRGDEPRIVLGIADVPSEIDLGEVPDEVPEALREDVGALVTTARTVLGAPLAIDVRSLGVVGPEPMRSAVLRAIALQLCAAVPPVAGIVRAPSAEGWARDLPHPVRPAQDGRSWELTSGETVYRWAGAGHGSELPPGLRAIVRIADGDDPDLTVDGVGVPAARIRLAMVSAGTAGLVARRLRDAAEDPAGSSSLPAHLPLDALRDGDGILPDDRSVASGAGRGRLRAVVGVDVEGPVWLDLVADGPHAIIGGTTGSGKSELLVTWVLALCERHRVDEVSFLLIDFKGGSAFAPLAGLPHVVGVVSDLDASTARRAVASLRSEVLRRERLIADAGARDIAAVPAVARLVVVVDEYAALVAEQPELHEAVADLASRGRSLGIHLVLCTQRPGGAIRDQVLANAGLRICLRVNNRADSIAVIGTDAAASLDGAPAGRALLRVASGELRTVQCAIAGEDDATRLSAARTDSDPPPFRPWADPLPALVRPDELAWEGEGIPFGLVDLPEQQRVAVAAYAPERDGNLLVVGGRRAGTSSALATIGRGVGAAAVVAPRGLADAWTVLSGELAAGTDRDGRVVLVDDVDLIIDAADEDQRPGLVRLLAGLARELPARGGALVVGASRVPVGASALLSRIDSRLLLNLPDREQHVLAGGEGREWTGRSGPGRAWWHGREVQVALGDPLRDPAPPPIPEHSLEGRDPVAIVTTDPARALARLAERGFGVDEPGAPPVPGRAVVGEPDEWVAAWSALEAARRSGALLLLGCTPAELRSVVRARADPPPLDPLRSEGWILRARRLERIRVPWLEPRA